VPTVDAVVSCPVNRTFRVEPRTTAHPAASGNEPPHGAEHAGGRARGRTSARVGPDARGGLSLSLLYSSTSTRESERDTRTKRPQAASPHSDETPARGVACGEVLPIRSDLGGLVLGLAGLAVAIDQESLLLEAAAVVRRRRPETPAS